MTKKEILKQKRNLIHQAISSAMTLLEQSEFNQSNLWPKYFTIEWHPNKNDHFTMAARIDDDIDSKRLIINAINHKRFEKRMNNQLMAIELILDQAINDNIFFQHQRHSIAGLNIQNIFGQIIFKFTIL